MYGTYFFYKSQWIDKNWLRQRTFLKIGVGEVCNLKTSKRTDPLVTHQFKGLRKT